MKRSILDTDTLSYALDGRDERVARIARQYLRVFRHYTVSVVSVSESVEGFEKSRNASGLSAFLAQVDGFEVLPVETEEAILAGRILGALAREGQKIGDLDPFIAAVAITHGLPLVTNNVRHYQRIVELGFPLELDNWRS